MAKTAPNALPNVACSYPHSQFQYHASAYGLAAEIERPIKQSVHAQAATALSTGGGRGTERVDEFRVAPFVSFKAAYSEVGGSYDSCHNMHTTYASAVIEGLNVFDVVMADRVVSRMVIYSYGLHGDESEPRYDITGSHFDNLRVAGHPIDVKLPTSNIHNLDQYSKFEPEIQKDKFLTWGSKAPDDVEKLEDSYHALNGMGDRARKWAKDKASRKGGAYRAAAAPEVQLSGTNLISFGNIICVPKFGIVRLAELVVHKDYRRLTMFNVQMCSGTYGGSSGGGSQGSGGMGG